MARHRGSKACLRLKTAQEYTREMFPHKQLCDRLREPDESAPLRVRLKDIAEALAILLENGRG